jgi:hypothetical protein
VRVSHLVLTNCDIDFGGIEERAVGSAFFLVVLAGAEDLALSARPVGLALARARLRKGRAGVKRPHLCYIISLQEHSTHTQISEKHTRDRISPRVKCGNKIFDFFRKTMQTFYFDINQNFFIKMNIWIGSHTQQHNGMTEETQYIMMII